MIEAKRANDGQTDGHQQYEALVQSIDGIVWEADAKTFRFGFVSQQAERILGYPVEQWLQEPNFWADHLHPDDKSWAVEFCVQAAARQEAHQFEYRMIAADERVVWLRDIVTVNVLNDQSVRLRGVMTDITMRKQAEEACREQQEILQKIFDHIPVMITFFDADGQLKMVNREWERTLGWSLQEIRDQDLDILAEAYPDDHSREVAKNSIVTASGEWADFKVRVKSGRVRDMSWANVRLLDGTRVGIGQDITERKQAEEAIRQAEAKYRSIFENTIEGIFQTTPDGRFIAANPALARMFGFESPEELMRERADISKQHYVEPELRKEFKRLLEEQGVVRDFELQAYRKDGVKIWVSENVRAVRDENGALSYYEGTTEDITERKRSEETLRSYARQLIEAQETERQHLARELHDQIGQSLTAIRINLQTVRQAMPTSESTHLIDEGVTAVDEALQQVRDLSFELRPSLLDDLGLVVALRWYSSRFAERTGIPTTILAALPKKGMRLRRELETACFRIAQEALTNAARHAQANIVSINLKMLNNEILLSIKDDGVGFEVVSAAHSPVHLGLRGMEERVLALGGRLEIVTAPSQGTEIRGYFPNQE